ncbi:MAG: hypothetical protein NW208_06405 [Bryobacter sp.]|nr:hypothetical protein [Bryobacter sp.]
MRSNPLFLAAFFLALPLLAQIPQAIIQEELARRQPNTPFRLTLDPSLATEAFRLRTSPSLEIAASTTRGFLYGLGHYLMHANTFYEITSAPAYALRGHQLGYRATANSYDAWTIAQYDDYIRELVLAGANAIENIPFQDTKPAPLMKVSRPAMHRALSEICLKYGIEYWVWVPADFDLTNTALRTQYLAQIDTLAASAPTLSGFFFPGGDPGHNPPDLVLALLADVAPRLKARHPQAKIWLSLQGFNLEKEEAVYQYIEKTKPSWLGGLVAGPSSPPLARTRNRLPAQYGLRLYPDLTHNKLAQFEVPEWDQAYALTLGREAINPRPAQYTEIFHRIAPWSTGFLSYSDGAHDDVNKFVFTRLAWNPQQSPRELLQQYARLFLPATNPARAADAILALERNWRGPLATNGAVESTLASWPSLGPSWRAQMLELRAVYDAYVRRRLLDDTAAEQQANAALRESDAPRALSFLRQAPGHADLRARIASLCESLYQSIGLQTSVEKYGASGAERGAILDFLDLPLNNRYWLEDEIAKVASLPAQDRPARLQFLGTWENPTPGSFYDDLGHIARSPRVQGPFDPTYWWLSQGRSRLRLSQQITMWPARLVYEALDPRATYVLRTTGYGKHLPAADGQPLTQTKSGEQNEFAIPAHLLTDRRLEVTFTIPTDEAHLNWRQHSRLAEVWLVRLPD